MPPEQRGQTYRTTNGWGVRWYENGRRPRKAGFSSKSAALTHYRDDIRPRLRGDSSIDARRTTLADFTTLYLAAHSVGREESTITTLRARMSRPLAAFGDVTLRDLERRVVEIAAWRATTPERSRSGVTAAMRQTIDAAVRWGVMTTNPVRLAGSNRQPKRPEIIPFTRAEIDRLAELGPYAPMLRFAVETGMRPSEWLAVERRDVRGAEGVVLVKRTYVRGKLKAHGKTTASRRRVPLSALALGAIDAAPPRIDTPLVWPSASGLHLDLHNWRARYWIPALDAAGLEKGRRIYDLRHTFATEALAAGLSTFAVARYVGTSVRMLDATYGHLALGSDDAARALLDARADVRATTGPRITLSADPG